MFTRVIGAQVDRPSPDQTNRFLGNSWIQGYDRSPTCDAYVKRLLSIIELDWLRYPPWGRFVAEDESGFVGFLLSER